MTESQPHTMTPGQGCQPKACPRFASLQEAYGWHDYGMMSETMLSRFACGLSFFMIPHLATAATAAGLPPAAGATAVALYGVASLVGALAGGLAADRWGRVPTLLATYGLRGLGALALACPCCPPGGFTAPWPWPPARSLPR